MEKNIKLTLNGVERELTVKPNVTLLEAIRDKLRFTGTKYGCGAGECGACTVLVNGKPILSCLALAVDFDGKQITTVEGLAKDGKLSKLQEAFIESGAFQCGYCTPGMLLTAKALLDENPNPSEGEIREYMKGNLCRCGSYDEIVMAILAAAKK